MSRVWSAAVVAAVLLLAPASASAADVSLSLGNLLISDSGGQDNQITIDRSGTTWTVTEQNFGVAPLAAGSGCTGGPQTVTCTTTIAGQATVNESGGTNAYTMNAATSFSYSGGPGSDTVTGGPGPGSDSITGGDGNDVLNGRGGTNTLYGGAGADTFTGGTGATDFTEVSYAADGASRPQGVTVTFDATANDGSTADGAGDNVTDTVNAVSGTPQADHLTGGGVATRPRVLRGGDAADTITAGTPNNVNAGVFGDILIGGPGNDTLGDGPGSFDVVSYDYVPANGPGVTATLGVGGTGPGGNDTDTYVGTIEELDGSDASDTLTGSAGNDYLKGKGGSDHLDGGAGDDHLYGDSDNPSYYAGPDEDDLTGGPGNDRLVGNEDDDTLHLDDGGVDNLGGGSDCDGPKPPFGATDGAGDTVIADAGDPPAANCENTGPGGTPANPPPSITITAPASGAFTDDQPVFTGTAGASPPNADHVIVKLHRVGTTTDLVCPPISVGASGAFSGTCANNRLSDGAWTFTVSQNGDGNPDSAVAGPRTFTVDTTAPTVAVTSPDDNSIAKELRPVFRGTASNDAGDDDHVQLEIRSFGQLVTRFPTIREGTGWGGRPGVDLNPGQSYTVQASTTDARGHEAKSDLRTFRVVLPPRNTAPPVMSGPEAAVGVTLSGTVGTWDNGGGNVHYLGLWQRCTSTSLNDCENVGGGVYPQGASFKIRPEDFGYRFIWVVVAVNEADSVAANSGSFTRVVPAPGGQAGSGGANGAGAGNPSVKPPLPAQAPAQSSSTCQRELAFGPIGVKGACLKRVGLTWESSAEVSVNGIHLVPSGGSAKVIIDPMNLRVAAQGQVAIVVGPATIAGNALGPYTLWKGGFDWVFQPNIQLPDAPGLATAVDFAKDYVKANFARTTPARAAINVDRYSYADLQKLPGLEKLPSLPRLPGLGLPDFSRLSVAELKALRIPTINDVAKMQIPAYYLQDVQLPPLALDTKGANLFGFGVDGKAAMQLVDDGANFDVGLDLKQLGNLSAEAKFKVTNAGQIVTKDVKAHADEINLGLVSLRPFNIAFDGATNTWDGSATGFLPFPNPTGLGATVRVVNGQLRKVGVNYDGNLALGTSGVFLSHIDFTYDNGPPTKLTSGINLSAGPKVASLPRAIGLDGQFTYIGGDPSKFALTGNASVAGFPLGDAGMEYHTNGYFHARGHIGLHVDSAGKYGVDGVVDGWATKSRFNLDGSVTLKTPGFSLGAHGVLSSVGLAGCAKVQGGWFNGFSLGAGFKWGAKSLDWLGGSCDMGKYSAVYNGTARAAQVGFTRAFDVKAGQRAVSFAVHGAGGPPRITLAGPGGVTVATPAATLDGVKTDRTLLIQDATSNTTYVIVGKPGAGKWTITGQAGSVPVTEIDQAGALPAASVRAQVLGKGRAQQLRWSLTPIKGQTVQFVERAGDVARVLTETAAPAGTLRFTPSDGRAGRRTIEAVVLQDGLVRTTATVASFTAPRSGPARPGKVHARLRRGKLVVTWGAAAGAVRYRVLATVDGGRRILVAPPGRRRSATIPGVFSDSPVKVQVTGVDSANAAGPPGRAALRPVRIAKPVLKGLKPAKRG